MAPEPSIVLPTQRIPAAHGCHAHGLQGYAPGSAIRGWSGARGRPGAAGTAYKDLDTPRLDLLLRLARLSRRWPFRLARSCAALRLLNFYPCMCLLFILLEPLAATQGLAMLATRTPTLRGLYARGCITALALPGRAQSAGRSLSPGGGFLLECNASTPPAIAPARHRLGPAPSPCRRQHLARRLPDLETRDQYGKTACCWATCSCPCRSRPAIPTPSSPRSPRSLSGQPSSPGTPPAAINAGRQPFRSRPHQTPAARRRLDPAARLEVRLDLLVADI